MEEVIAPWEIMHTFTSIAAGDNFFTTYLPVRSLKNISFGGFTGVCERS